MAPTAITTLVMILFSVGVLALALYGWFGSWELATRRVTPDELLERDYRAGVQEMRRAIADYERGHRTL
jgi:cytochrome c-type biogenesis protein CcmH/NrfG